ncbi:aminoacyl-tRNA hydrolase [Candidatus Gracilibacteria bacterium]|nr:aminoacyl-tRNA hydrolase [Candidatus Gracilibacteria bacterium]
MKLIIGLGNPGPRYHHTRHNVGYQIVENMFTDWREDLKVKSLISKNPTFLTIISPILCVQPQTYMNLSGDAVATLVSFYKLDPRKDILVISDDIDMEFGKVRYRSEGSHGGQNGLRDIIAKLGTSEFARIKIGVGRDDRYEVSDWVLSRFTESEKEIIATEVTTKVEEYIIKWLCD